MRKYRRAFSAIHHWLLILKPGQCIEFIATDFGINKNTMVEYVEQISRIHYRSRFATCSTGADSIGVRRLVDAEVANG